MTAFDRLAPALQYHVVNTLLWPNLRPVQSLTIDTVLDGSNCVVLAPTAGGKTEAAFFPLLSKMDVEDWRPVSVIYLSPIRALLNNQEPRLTQYASLLGRRVFKWHGDVGDSPRKRFMREPADILLTTPESLEAMLISSRVPTRELFANLQAVVIDEVHAFADDDRGAHLSALLERVSRFCARDFQRIGLSATVGNPDEILRWLQGSSQRASSVVRPASERREPEITVDFVGSLDNAAQVISQLHQGQKRLVFVDARQKVESVGKHLLLAGIDAYVIHGSLSVDERQHAERMFAEGQNCVIVATSAMELGIDIGDLDRVIQIDSPGAVSSFLQRMGRTGRRANAASNCTFLCTEQEGLLEACALVHLFRKGFVEAVDPWRRASHVLAHQLMALALQQSGLPRSDVFAWLEGASAFAGLSVDERLSVVDYMLDQGILADQDGLIAFGPEGERLFGRRNFQELYAVFSTPRLVTVRWGAREIGSLDAQFLMTLQEKNEGSAFTLGGRAWTVSAVDWQRGVCAVEPAHNARAARWPGRPRFLSYEVCQGMRQLLLDSAIDPSWSRRTRESMAELRAEHAFLAVNALPLTDIADGGLRWWTFAGGRANNLLARMFEAELGGKCAVRNTSIDLLGSAGHSQVAVRQFIRQLGEQGRPNAADAEKHAQGAVRSRVSKFEPCLPPVILQRLWADSVMDVVGARAALNAAR